MTECLALLHELKQYNEHPDAEHLDPAEYMETPLGVRLERTKSIESSKGPPMDTNGWFQAMSRSAEKLLRSWVEKNLLPEHYMSTVLEPRFKQLQLICNDIEK